MTLALLPDHQSGAFEYADLLGADLRGAILRVGQRTVTVSDE